MQKKFLHFPIYAINVDEDVIKVELKKMCK